jgi:subtilisin-like proprotein convertase family protein
MSAFGPSLGKPPHQEDDYFMSDHPSRLTRASRTAAASTAVALLATAAVGTLATPASALPDKSVTATSTTPIKIPDFGFADPASSALTVPADKGVVTDVDVTLTGLDHTCIEDLTVVVVAPNGKQAMLISDAGNCSTNPTPVNLTLDDEATDLVPSTTPLPSGTYKPTDEDSSTDPADPVYAPASLANLDGSPASGTWTLHAFDGSGADFGTLGGWSLDIDYNDTVAPSGTVTIDGGAASTDSTSVTLDLSATDPAPGTGVAQVRFSNDGTNWSAFQAYTATASWTLAAGDGTKTVWAQYADGIGNVSTTASDTIVLDTKAPKAKKLSPKNNATGVKVSTKVSFVASEALDKATVTKKTVKLTAGGKAVKAKVSYKAGSKKVVLKPKKDLAPHTTYKVKLSKKITDVAGNSIAAKGWKFTTA